MTVPDGVIYFTVGLLSPPAATKHTVDIPHTTNFSRIHFVGHSCINAFTCMCKEKMGKFIWPRVVGRRTQGMKSKLGEVS